jgi:hypothetical protein
MRYRAFGMWNWVRWALGLVWSLEFGVQSLELKAYRTNARMYPYYLYSTSTGTGTDISVSGQRPGGYISDRSPAPFISYKHKVTASGFGL